MRVYGIISYIYGRTVLGNASFSSGPVLTSPSGWSMINYTKAEFNPGIKSKNHTVSRWQETRQLLPILIEPSSSCVRQRSPPFLPACTAELIQSLLKSTSNILLSLWTMRSLIESEDIRRTLCIYESPLGESFLYAWAPVFENWILLPVSSVI